MSSRSACSIAGVSYRQLDYWCHARPDVFGDPTMAKGTGSRRRWDDESLERLAKAADLIRWSRSIGGGVLPVDLIARFVMEADMVSCDDGPCWRWITDQGDLIVQYRPPR